MKKATYTLSCDKADIGNKNISKIEEKFERYMEGVAEKLIKADKKRIDKWFVHVRIEE
ncbi:TPA: hypothetical protein U1629_001727 [Streptococcus suis]|uniref:hypothetical protein n=1 Tax=Streptococcus TaxID=1301 RepID=UPI00145C071D|nr:hypothetical protein [Streptococcus suis]MBO3756855.1 hypothetical protein [Streptococcus suis]MBY4635114.1 hypothetical protein [Streptococcus suis]MCK4075242.1 hypothetical protein [Streptococcus suis]NQO22294.1 hypothetical protein [Streptococcus suis]NQP15582.1 hypothetical protein [Streptococcus suis]